MYELAVRLCDVVSGLGIRGPRFSSLMLSLCLQTTNLQVKVLSLAGLAVKADAQFQGG